MEHWGVVGGGLLGMTLAHRLRQRGHRVTLLEAGPELGGLASAWSIGDVVWDRHYHVILLSDTHLRGLLGECLRECGAFDGNARLDWSRQWEYPWVLSQLPPDGAGRRILDAGCGYRFFTPMLARRGFRVEGCDIDARIGADLLQRAHRARAARPGRAGRTADITTRANRSAPRALKCT